MSVYTLISELELREFLASYDLGDLVEFQGIGAGIENTNYFVTTTQGRFVLTLFEQLGWDELPYFLDLMAFLAEHGVPSAHPLADRQGGYLRTLKDKSAALVRRLPGRDVTQPNPVQCAAMGHALGHLHAVGVAFGGQRQNQRGAAWWHATATQVLPQLAASEAELLRRELDDLAQHHYPGLPSGVIHADLFRDNALFEGDQLTGLIDFYYACNDVLLYDVAVTVNDWCIQASGQLDPALTRAFLTAYHAQRPFTAHEFPAWPYMLRAAALRFWLSRLRDYYFPRPGELTHTKDPRAFERILRAHLQAVPPLRAHLANLAEA